MGKLKIRNVNPNDLNEISEIENLCFPKAEAATLESFKERIEVFADSFYVGEYDNKIVSFINGSITDNIKIIDEMYDNIKLHSKNGSSQAIFGVCTRPDYQKQGFAGEIINHLIEESKRKGLKGITLCCKEHKIPYYSKFGFKNLGVSDSVHGGAVWYDMYKTL